uniref:Uncharacterized protein n=1 Tax=Rhizophora mucronata TaxID=61149 RepID=A0A2P2QV24_RHIMU
MPMVGFFYFYFTLSLSLCTAENF